MRDKPGSDKLYDLTIEDRDEYNRVFDEIVALWQTIRNMRQDDPQSFSTATAYSSRLQALQSARRKHGPSGATPLTDLIQEAAAGRTQSIPA